MTNGLDVRQAVCELDGKDGKKYGIVACVDETLAITRNGQMMGERRWPASQTARCVNELYRLAGREVQGIETDG